jgi:hypothetical protein
MSATNRLALEGRRYSLPQQKIRSRFEELPFVKKPASLT